MPSPSPRAHFSARAAPLWGLLWRISLVVVLGFVTFSLVWAEFLDSPDTGTGPLTAVEVSILLDLLLGVLAIALYPLRRRWPLPIVILIVAASALSSLAYVAAAFGIVSLATRRRRREITLISLASVASMVLSEMVSPASADPLPWWQALPIGAGLTAVLVLTGLYIGGRRQLVAVLEDRAEQLQREHDVRIEAAAMAERTRIARDMHDALAHRLSLVALHAGVLEYRADLSPEQARAAAGIVRENAHLAASDLREVLGVLRDPLDAETTGTTRAPHSTIEAVELLIEDNRVAGNPTRLSLGDRLADRVDDLPASTRGHLHRVVQEGLTNVRKHAPGERIEVHLDGSPGQRLCVSLTNRMPTAPGAGAVSSQAVPRIQPVTSGFGLVGLRERVHVAGGEMTAAEADGQFALSAWFPWPT